MKYYLHFTAKFVCFLLLNFCCSSLSAQVTFTSYHKKDGEETKQQDSAYFIRTVHLEAQGKENIYRIEEYYLHNDSLKLNSVSKNGRQPFKYQCKKYEFFENGTLKSLENFSDNSKLVDSAFYLYPNNKLKMMVFYPSEVKKKKLVINKPVYIVYYDSLNNKTLENGTGHIHFSVDEKGGYEEGSMVNNLREGEWKGRIGRDSFVESYKEGKLLSGTKTKANGTTIRYDSTSYKVEPEYPGGKDQLMFFIAKNFEYPKQALINEVSGILEISFFINQDGKVGDIKVKEDLGFGTGEAGINVVKKLRKWKPGMRRGEPVRVAYTLPIRLNTVRR